MKNILPVLLLLVGATLAIYGIITWQDAGTSVEFGGMELSAENDKQSTSGIFFMVLGVLVFGGGLYTWKRR